MQLVAISIAALFLIGIGLLKRASLKDIILWLGIVAISGYWIPSVVQDIAYVGPVFKFLGQITAAFFAGGLFRIAVETAWKAITKKI